MVILVFSDKQLADLKSELYTSRKNAYAAGSAKNLRIQWESFLLFCFHFQFCYLPADTETLCLYSQFLSRSFKSTSAIKNYISGVKTMHLLLGYSIEHINNFLLNLGLKGIARLNPYCTKQAKAITPEILLEFSKVLNFSSHTDCIFWCLFLFAFFLFARKSNLVPTTKKDLIDRKCLLYEDIKEHADVLIVSFRWSKTIQFGERVLETPLVKIPGSVLCPVSAYHNMCRFKSFEKHDALFTLPSKRCIFYRDFQAKLKFLIHKIGLNPEEFSSHSFRRGGCSFCFKSDVPSELIQLHGDWRSDAYKKYLAFSLDDKIGVAEKMKQQILLHHQ